MPASQRPAQAEWELAEADYLDVIEVISGMLRACERTPSIVTDKSEEALRDLVLIVLNGTYRGTATGETFVKLGRTDILVQVENRHVFVGECKWWSGPVACGTAIDQLLGYLPWRNEKAALIFFIGRQNATAIIDKAHLAVKEHPSFVREGPMTSDPASQRNYILKHADDEEREIQLAVLFAVIAGQSSSG